MKVTPSACLTDEVNPRQLLQKLSIEPLTFNASQTNFCKYTVSSTGCKTKELKFDSQHGKQIFLFSTAPRRAPMTTQTPRTHPLRIMRPSPTDDHCTSTQTNDVYHHTSIPLMSLFIKRRQLRLIYAHPSISVLSSA